VSGSSIVVIGNFDGVHKGHQAVLRQAHALAAKQPGESRCVVLTFDPHPSEVLGRGPKPRLTTMPMRIELLRANGADEVVVEPFTTDLAAWEPERFARELLAGRLGARAVVVGTNFRFGHNRAGDFDTLSTLGAQHGFEAVAAAMTGDSEGPFSSTRVRTALAAGDVSRAAELLGRPHSLGGVVVKGDQRGRTIGFPTANLDGVEEMLPAYGVYAIRVDLGSVSHVLSGAPRLHDGVANIGMRPTVGGASLRIEAHVFDYAGDLYGAPIRIELVERLRGEQKFAGIDELRAQIANDADAARRALAAKPGV